MTPYLYWSDVLPGHNASLFDQALFQDCDGIMVALPKSHILDAVQNLFHLFMYGWRSLLRYERGHFIDCLGKALLIFLLPLYLFLFLQLF